MKLKPEHVKHIQTEINRVLQEKNANGELVRAYQTGNFYRADKVKDLQMRFCFDLMYAAGLSGWISDNIYSYANDTHIYTALKQICPVVTPVTAG